MVFAMRRKISVLILSALLLLALFSFASCGNSSDNVFTYYRTVTTNGAKTEYVLTVDEKNNTFSVNCESVPEESYSGTFMYKNGYIVLTSAIKGEEYVALVGDEFSYFTPQKEADHTHVFELVSETTGTCVKQGLKTYACTICGEEKNVSSSLGTHAYDVVSRTAGTCVKKEKTVYRCRYCNDEKTVEGDLDPDKHSWNEENRDDSGCLAKISVTRRCRDCNTLETARELDEYGSHRYDENGVCIHCGFDESGFCHSLIDEDEDGICDGYDVPVSVAEAFSQNGFSLTDDVLYFGVYPTERVDLTVETLEKDGEKDPITGFYRYNRLSYQVIDRNGEQAVFAVKILTWKFLRENASSYTYVCTAAIDAGYYLSPTEIIAEEKWVEIDKKITKTTTYYHKNPDENGEKIVANSFTDSDAYAFLNNKFLSAFTEKQKTILTSDPITLPDKAFADADSSVVFSDYARIKAASASYFTCTPSEKTNAVYGSSFGESTEKNVTSILGFVPVITIRLPD